MAEKEEPKAPKPTADQAAYFKLADIVLKAHMKPEPTLEFQIKGSPVLIAEYWWTSKQLKLYVPPAIYPPEIEPEERETEKAFSNVAYDAAFAMVVAHLLKIFSPCNDLWPGIFTDDEAEDDDSVKPATPHSDAIVSWMLNLFEKIFSELATAPHTIALPPLVIKNRAVALVGEAQHFYLTLHKLKSLATSIDSPEEFMARVEELLGLHPDDDEDDDAENEDVDEDENDPNE